jgi:single-strand DNA-binding protein
MSGTVNKVILIGNIGKDPELKSFENGGKILSFSLATQESWKDSKSNEKVTQTDWHNVVIRRTSLAELGDQYLKKGMKVYVEGKIRNRSYQVNGETKYITEIFADEFTMLSPKSTDAAHQPMALNEPAVALATPSNVVDNDDALPF